jgi:HK97 gp10 family phage protein
MTKAFKVDSKVEGIQPFLKKLDTLAKKDAQKGLSKAIDAGLKIVIAAMKSSVREQTRTMKRSIGKKRKKKGKTVYGMAGPKADYEKQVTLPNGQTVTRKPQKYEHFVELGTVKSQDYPFIAPALEQHKGEVQSAMADEILKALGA